MYLQPPNPSQVPSRSYGWKYRLRRWLGVFIVVALLVVILLGSAVSRFAKICEHYATIAEGSPPLPSDVKADEAIVVLTGDRHRIPKALDLLRSRQAPLLIISGTGKGATLTDLVNQQGGAKGNIHQIWTRIVVESNSSSTIENAVQSGKILRARGIHRIILVTSEYHMARASQIFHRALPAIEIIEYPVASDVSEISWDPSEKTLSGLWYFGVEFWKRMIYQLYSFRKVSPVL